MFGFGFPGMGFPGMGFPGMGLGFGGFPGWGAPFAYSYFRRWRWF